VLLGDTMGEMALYYAASDVALIGGSLLPFGAQNLIEACAVGTPVVLGSSVYNFEQAARDALAAGAAVQVQDATAALDAMARIGTDAPRRAAMASAAASFAQAHRGATARTVARLLALLTGSAAR
jgi:3-deoxy-D-manno-octulosonic-acid transferase